MVNLSTKRLRYWWLKWAHCSKQPEQDGDEPAIVVLLSLYHAIHLPAIFCFWIFWLTIWKMKWKWWKDRTSQLSEMLTLQLLKLVSTVTSTDVLVYEGLRGKRFNFWILNLVMVRIEKCHPCSLRDWDGAHNSCAWSQSRSGSGLRLLLISFFLGLSNRSGMLVGGQGRHGSSYQLRVCLTLFQHPLLRKSIFFIAWWPSGNQLHGFAGKSPRNSSILFPAINLLGL